MEVRALVLEFQRSYNSCKTDISPKIVKLYSEIFPKHAKIHQKRITSCKKLKHLYFKNRKRENTRDFIF